MKRPLATIAHTRSGDKGDTSNIGVIALRPEYYRNDPSGSDPRTS